MYKSCNSIPQLWLGYIQDENRQRAGPSGFWTIEFYQPYFDVDTSTVRYINLSPPPLSVRD